jgi:hypothetical protein
MIETEITVWFLVLLGVGSLVSYGITTLWIYLDGKKKQKEKVKT